MIEQLAREVSRAALARYSVLWSPQEREDAEQEAALHIWRAMLREPCAARGYYARAPSMFIRIVREWREGRERMHLYVGRGLYYALGSPKRLDIQRLAGRIHLSPAAADAGYAVQVGGGMPRFFADGARELLEDLEDGRYTASVEAGAIAMGERLP